MPLNIQPRTLSQQLEGQEINPQGESPLYNLIPPEIRTVIFQLALTESEIPMDNSARRDFGIRYDHDPAPLDLPEVPEGAPNIRPGRPGHRDRVRGFDWSRPDSVYPWRIHIGLLRTCKRVYLEAHHLPLMQKEYDFYFFRGPPGNFRNKMEAWSSVPGYRRRELVRSVRFFAQFYWLEDRSPNGPRWISEIRSPLFRNIEQLRITLRRTDWWHWEHNYPLAINPYRGNANHRGMIEDMHEMEQGRAVQLRQNNWASDLQILPNLKKFIIDFETSEFKKAEMEKIVSWATKWEFPLHDACVDTPGSTPIRRHLSAEGNPIEKMSWRGSIAHWSDRCEVCQGSRSDCPQCPERGRLMMAAYGPRLLVWTVTWKAVRSEVADTEHSQQ